MRVPQLKKRPPRGFDTARILDLLDEGVVLVDTGGRILWLNSSMERFCGRPRSEVRGLPVPDFVGACIMPRLSGKGVPGDHVQRVLASGEAKELEFCLAGPGGERWITYSSRILDEPPFRGCRLDTYQDITAGKQAELSAAHLSAIVQSSDDAIISKTLDGIILSWNRGAEKIYGYSEGEVLGRSIALLFPPDRQEELPRILQRIRSGESIEHYETVRVRKDGKEINVSITVSPIRDSEGRIIAVSTIARDITERRRAEDALRERERRLSAIFEAAHNVAFVTTDLAGKESRILDFSPGAEMIFGYWKDEVVGKKVSLLYIPDEREKLSEIHRKMRKREVEFSGEITLIRKNGEQFPALLTMYPLRDNSGAVKAALSVAIDITVLKRAEAQIRASLEEKENLLREIHHRVKNNMQVISALLALQAKKTRDEKVLEMFRDSEHRIKAMALIHEKLYQSRSFGTINLSEYLTRLIQYLFRSYEERSAGVTLSMDVHDISLDLDTALPCSLIINELVSNSLKYAFPEGKGKICIKVGRDGEGGYVMEIRDNGIGLPRGLDMEKTETLGLRLVKGLAVNQLGGSLELGKGKGTTFIIRFPEMKR